MCVVRVRVCLLYRRTAQAFTRTTRTPLHARTWIHTCIWSRTLEHNQLRWGNDCVPCFYYWDCVVRVGCMHITHPNTTHAREYMLADGSVHLNTISCEEEMIVCLCLCSLLLSVHVKVYAYDSPQHHACTWIHACWWIRTLEHNQLRRGKRAISKESLGLDCISAKLKKLRHRCRFRS